MALQKQLVALPIDKGLDTKTDPKQQELGFLTKAENLVYETLKLLKKRNGYDLIDLYDTSDAQITEPVAIAKYKNELLAFTRTKIYSYSETRTRFVEKGSIYPTATVLRNVIKNAGTQTEIDSKNIEGFTVYTWVDNGAVKYSVQDTDTGTFILSNQEIAASGRQPVIANVQGYVFVIYGDGANLKYRRFSILEPHTLEAAVTAATDRNLSPGLIDAESTDDRVVVAYQSDNAGDNLSIFTIDQTGTASSIIGVSSENPSDALDVLVDSLYRIIVTFSDGTDIRYTIYPLTLTTAILNPTVIETLADVSTCCTLEISSGVYKVYYEKEVAGQGLNYVSEADLTVGGSVTNNAVFKRNVGLGARAFRRDDVTYIVCVGDSEVQSSYFVFDEDGALVTKFANQVSAGTITYGVLQPVNVVDDNKYLIPLIIHNRLESDNGTFFSTDGVVAAIMDFDPEYKFSNAELADSLHVCAGVLKMYDGASVVEHGFHVFPETLSQTFLYLTVTPATTTQGDTGVTDEVQTLTFSATPTSGSFKLNYSGENTAAINWNDSNATIKAAIEATTYITGTVTVTGTMAGGLTITYDNAMGNVVQPTIVDNTLSTATTSGSMSDGSYGYLAVYRWTDNTGKDHFSSPTQTPLEVTLSGGTSTQRVDVLVPTLRITDKSNVVIDLYRTEDAGTTYYKVTSTSAPTLNVTTADTVTISDTLSDAQLISRELLYTTGGVLENIAAPACSQIEVYNGERLVVIGEDGFRVFFSKQVNEAGPVEFTDGIYRDMPQAYGHATTLKTLGEKLIIFTMDACYFVSGEGPNNFGQQDTLNKPEVIATDIGCISPKSAVLTPVGIMFQSRKGLWMLSAGLGLKYTGDRVERYNGQTVTSAQVIGALNQIRFTLSEDRALVYNYQIDRWGTFENHGGLDSVTINNDYYYLREDGALYKENRTSFSDAGSPIKFRIETGWMSLTELQGFQRVFLASILGSYKSAHKLRVRIAYDFVDAWIDEETIDPLDFIDPSTWGSDETWGSGSVYGSAGNLYQAQVSMKRQKCTSMKLLIEDVQSTPGEGLSLSGITMRVGAKEGNNKLGRSNKYGAS